MQLTATYRINTPMFLGEANQQETSLRPPSFKGALRFWWRAIHWPLYRARASDDATALKDLHQQEGKLFGQAFNEKIKHSGQSCFSLHIRDKAKIDAPPKPSCGHQYLLGQGLYRPGSTGGYLRLRVLLEGTIEASLHFRPQTSVNDQLSIAKSLVALGTFGGLGSRARKGFGSLSIISLTGIDNADVPIAHNIEQLKEVIRWLGINTASCDYPPLTAFSKYSRIDLSMTHTDSWKTLNSIGNQQQLYRSWGQNNTVCGQDAEKNFPNDHHWAQQASHGQHPHQLPKRIVFGLPHNYFFSSTHKKADMAPATKERQRRASPLFIHIHQFQNNTYGALQILLPAKFLPTGELVEVKAQGLRNCKLPFSPDWSVITNYMDRFIKNIDFQGEQLI